MTKQQKIILYLLACVQFTSILDFMIMMPLSPMLMRALDTTPKGFSFLVSVYSFSAGIAGFTLAFFVDKFDRKKTLTVAYIGFLVGTLLCALAPNYTFMLMARVVAGVFGGVLGAQGLSIIGDLIPYERRAEAMGINTSGFAAASVLGVPLGVWLATKFTWHIPFVFVVVVGLFNLVMIYRYLPSMTAHIKAGINKPSPFTIITNIAKDSNQVLAILFSTVVLFGHFSTIPSISPYLTLNVGMPEDQLSLIYLVGGATTILTSRFFGRLADKVGKFPVFATNALLFLIPVYLLTNATYGLPLWAILTVTTLFFIFANGRMIPMQAMTSSVVTNAQRGGFTSINQSMIQMAAGGGAFVAGLIMDKTPDGKLLHYDWVGYMSMAFLVLGIFIGSKLKPVKSE